MHKKFEINPTKIKDGYQLGRKVITHNSKSDLPLILELNEKNQNNKIMLKSIHLCKFPNNAVFMKNWIGK